MNESHPVLTVDMTVRGKSRHFFAFGLLALVLASGCGPAPMSPHNQPKDIRRDATVEAIEQAIPSVVNIATTERHEIRDPVLDLLYGKSAPRSNSSKVKAASAPV